ncbi:MAG: hypothetical protein U9N51_03195 [Bacteroidota bacterium]|nr:hypothetical protein [Bacteroidota bacterium]
MRRIKLLFPILSMAAILLANTSFATSNLKTDTLKVIVNGEVEAVVNMSDLDALEDLDIDIDSIMMEVENVLKSVDENMQDIEIIEKEGKKTIIIKSADGEIIEKVDLDDDFETENGKNSFEVNFEIDKKEKNLHSYLSVEIGANNYLMNSEFEFPEGNSDYVVKPFGSWSFSIGSGMRAYATNWLSFDFGGDLLWYNFKMEDKTVLITEADNPSQIQFSPNAFYDTGDNDAIRSKLRVGYVNFNLVPVFHIGNETGGFNKRTFRIGAGAYAGYRIGSITKLVYENNGNKIKAKNSDNFYLNNFRYGVKAIIGIKEVNLFVNYDLNSLFEDNKGPNGETLNAFAFGLNITI